MNDKIMQGLVGLMFAFVAFLGAQLFSATNDIVRLNQSMNLLVTPDMKIVPSAKHSSHELARTILDARITALEKDNEIINDEINYMYKTYFQ